MRGKTITLTFERIIVNMPPVSLMKIPPAVFLFLIALTGCEKKTAPGSTEEEGEGRIRMSATLNNREVPEGILTLGSQPDPNLVPDGLVDNLFGTFLCDRAEFYIIDEPQNELYDTKVETITLYYLDERLRQSKYLLTKDVVQVVIENFGSFRISGHDEENKAIIRDRKVMVKGDSGRVFNSALDNYEIKWDVGDKEIRYRVNRKARYKYVYREMYKDYEQSFREIERLCFSGIPRDSL